MRNFKILVFLLACTFSACGHSEYATVRLVTGLEDYRLPNLIDQFTLKSFFIVSSCVQPEVYAGWKVYNPNGGSTDPINTVKVSLTTPAIASMSGTLGYADGVAGWLNASTMAPITLQVATGLNIEFGILGAAYTTTSASDGVNCDEFSTPNVPNGSASIEGHAMGMITGATSIGIKLWATDAAPAVANALPKVTSAACDTTNGGGGLATQNCPNLNFTQMTIACGGSTPCTSAGYIDVESFFATNGPQHIHHRIPMSAFIGTYGAIVEDINPKALTSYSNTAGLVALETVTFTGGSGSSNSLQFTNVSTNTVDGATTVKNISGSGVSGVPASFVITAPGTVTNSTCNPIQVSLRTATGANARLDTALNSIIMTFVGSSGAKIYSEGTCSTSLTPGSSATFSMPVSNPGSVTLYYKDTFAATNVTISIPNTTFGAGTITGTSATINSI